LTDIFEYHFVQFSGLSFGEGAMHNWLQDFRYAIRMLRKNIVMTLVIVASLGIGIGANSAIFSVVDTILLRPLPYPHPDRLAAVWLHSPGIGIFRDWPSPGQYIDLENENHSFEQMALAQSQTFTLTGREQPARVDGLRTQSTLLHTVDLKTHQASIIPGTEQLWSPRVSPDGRCLVGLYADDQRLILFDWKTHKTTELANGTIV
jgi:hypothetical protein